MKQTNILISDSSHTVAERIIKDKIPFPPSREHNYFFLCLDCKHGADGKTISNIQYTLTAYYSSTPDGNNWRNPAVSEGPIESEGGIPFQITRDLFGLSELEKILRTVKNLAEFGKIVFSSEQ